MSLIFHVIFNNIFTQSLNAIKLFIDINIVIRDNMYILALNYYYTKLNLSLKYYLDTCTPL